MRFKRYKTLIILVVFSLSLVSCNNQSVVEPSNTAVIKTPVNTFIEVQSEEPSPIATVEESKQPDPSSTISQSNPTKTPEASVPSTISPSPTVTAELTPSSIPTPVPTVLETPTPTVAIKKIVVSDYTGQLIGNIKIDGITIEVDEKISKTIDKGVVISQNIKSGTILEEGQTIILTVSTGQVELSFGYNVTTTKIPTEYTYGSNTFTINKYDNNVFLRTVNGIVVKHQLIFSDCNMMFFDGSDKIYYQKKQTGAIHSYSLSNRKDVLLINKNCSYFYYADGNIFYSTNQLVAQYVVSSKNTKTLVNIGSTYFQVYGNAVYVLESTSGSSKINEINISTGNTRFISSSGVSSFIINDFKVFYYMNNVLVYIDLYDDIQYQATDSQKAKLNF